MFSFSPVISTISTEYDLLIVTDATYSMDICESLAPVLVLPRRKKSTVLTVNWRCIDLDALTLAIPEIIGLGKLSGTFSESRCGVLAYADYAVGPNKSDVLQWSGECSDPNSNLF